MERDRLIEKIKKLLEVTERNGATEAEAVAAALAAQRLIAEADVEDWELGDDGEPVTSSRARRSRRWQSRLASAIADNFRCRNYIAYVPEGKSRRSVYECFHGHLRDAEAAKLVFERLSETGNREGRRYAAGKARELAAAGLRAEKKALFDTWASGFVDGVRLELEKQTKALMLVVPHDVDESFETIMQGAPTERRRRTDIYADPEIRHDGESAGRDAVRAGRVEAGGKNLVCA